VSQIKHPFGFRFVMPLALGSTLNPVNSSLIATALVPIGDYFHATTAQTAWLIAGLYLASAVAQPTMGRLADIFGPRRVFVTALAIVAIAGIIGVFASSLDVLILTRVLIGIGTSGAYPSAMRMFRSRGDAVGSPPPRTAMGVLSLSALGVSAIGPFLGGVLTAAFGWHAVFAVNFPLALAAMGFVLAWAPRDPPTDRGGLRTLVTELDLVGIGLFASALLCLMIFIMNFGQPIWPALIAGLALVAALIAWSLRRPDPFIDVRMLASNRPLSFTYLRIAAILLVGYCVFYGLAQWLQGAGGYSSAAAGLVTIPMSVVAAIASFFGARIASIRLSFALSTGAAFIGSAGLLFLGHDAPAWLIASAVACFGLVLGLTSTAAQAALYIQAPPDKIGVASGLQRTASYIGSIASASLLALTFGPHVTDAGFHTLMLVIGALSLLLTLAIALDPTLRNLRPAGRKGD